MSLTYYQSNKNIITQSKNIKIVWFVIDWPELSSTYTAVCIVYRNTAVTSQLLAGAALLIAKCYKISVIQVKYCSIKTVTSIYQLLADAALLIAKFYKISLIHVKYCSIKTITSIYLYYKRYWKWCFCTGMHSLYHLNMLNFTSWIECGLTELQYRSFWEET
jgi:hypothetical protein